MGDDDDSSSDGIPSWQRRDSPESPDPTDLDVLEPKPEPDSPAAEPAGESREELIALAAAWLEHPDIRDAPREGKESFLEGKGLTQDEIRGLLDTDATAAHAAEPSPTLTPSPPSTDDESSSAPHSADSTDISPTPADADTDTDTSSSSSPLSEPSTTSSQASDAPPIITYPEFLLQPAPKPPLVSRNAVVNVLAAATAAAGALHATSTYLVGPLFAELTAARHDLYGTTAANLDKLNTQLAGVVSRVPAAAAAKHKSGSRGGGADDESETSSSADPTELFHRDVGIQTTPPLSPLLAAADQAAHPVGVAAADAHAAKMARLRDSLAELTHVVGRAADARSGTAAELVELNLLLDGVRFGRRSQAKPFGAAAASTLLPGTPAWDEGEDEIDRVKKEVRGIKGVLLSARSFPAVASRGAAAR